MDLDVDQPIGACYANGNEMREAMVAIAQHSQDRGQQLEWAKHLRFLTPDRRYEDDEPASAANFEGTSSNSEDTAQSEESDCICNDAAVVFEHDISLRLSTQIDAPDCVHYIAVSYCWASFSKDSSSTNIPYSITQRDGSSRAPRCSSTLLSRVIQYATWKQYPFIWIDQECIDQNNPEDQSVGIQSMDLVYQRATESLAVLQTEITEQRHIDALQYLLEGGEDLIKNNDLASAYEAMQIIVTDDWFSRAWCLQESVSGNRTMTLLLQCSSDVGIPAIMGSLVHGCFELDLYQLHTVLASIPGSIQILAPDNAELQEKFELLADQWFNNMAPDHSNEYDAESRTICTAAQALGYLSRRYNSEVSDRLAILANLCDYSVRLDSLALKAARQPFSMCVYVLAIINGDFSIVLGSEDFRVAADEGSNKDTIEHWKLAEQSEEDYPFTWSIGKDCRLNEVSWTSHYMDPIRCAVTSASLVHGLPVQGCLWIADHVLDLGKLSSSYRARLSPNLLSFLLGPFFEEKKKSSDLASSDVKAARAEFSLLLLCHLYREGYTALHMLLWSRLRRNPTERQREDQQITAYSNATFEEIVDVETAAVKWPNPIPHRDSRKKRMPHPFHSLDTDLQRHLMQIILTTGTLTMARPLRTSPDLHNYAALFEVQEISSVFFTPKPDGSPDFVLGAGWHPRSWLVVPAGKPTEHRDTVRCQRMVSGCWQSKKGHEKTVLLQ